MSNLSVAPGPTGMVLAQALPADQIPALVYLSQIGASSRRTMRHALDTIAGILTCNQGDALTVNWGAVRYHHTAAIRSVLCEMYAPSTANRMLSALRKVLHAAWYLGYMDAETYQRSINIKDIKSERLPKGRALKPEEIAALMRVCAEDNRPAGVRDAAMFSIMCAGLRRSEVVKLNLADFDRSSGAIEVLEGKGKKDRITYLPRGGIEPVCLWIDTVRSDRPGPLFFPVNKGGRIVVQAEHMRDQGVLVMLKKRVEQAQIADCSPHDFRRTFITNLLAAGIDVITVQRLAGHSDSNTTARYDMRHEETKRQAVQQLVIPFSKAA